MRDEVVGVTDGTEQAPGTLILVDYGTRETWHHSVSFDKWEHATACGQAIGCGATNEVRMDISEWFDLETHRCCDECAGSVCSLAPGNERRQEGDPDV